MDNIFDFIGGGYGQSKVIKMATVSGEAIDEVHYLNIAKSAINILNTAVWTQGFNSNIRYATQKLNWPICHPLPVSCITAEIWDNPLIF